MAAFGIGMIGGEPDIEPEMTHILETDVTLVPEDVISDFPRLLHERSEAVQKLVFGTEPSIVGFNHNILR